MMLSMLSLALEKRAILGKALAGSRKAGKLPVVVYGAGHESMPFFVDAKSFLKTWRAAGKSTLVSLSETASAEGGKSDSKSGKNFDVLIHEVVTNPLSGEAIHADFLAIDVTKPVQVAVELHFDGVSNAVKNLGALLVKVLHQVEIKVLPKNLVQSISVDLSKLENFDDKIFAKDLVLPPTAELITGPEEIVALAAEPKEEVEEVAPVDLSAIEVEKKGKVEDAEGATEPVAPVV